MQLKMKRQFEISFEFFLKSMRPSFSPQLYERHCLQLQSCTFTFIPQMGKDKMECLKLNRNYSPICYILQFITNIIKMLFLFFKMYFNIIAIYFLKIDIIVFVCVLVVCTQLVCVCFRLTPLQYPCHFVVNRDSIVGATGHGLDD
jgi:hypothetical protein